MKSYLKFAIVLCVIACSIGASAGSIETFNYSTNLSGVSNTTVQGSFTYNTATNTFTGGSLSFVGNSIFGGLGGTDTQPQSGSTFVLNQVIGGYNVVYTIVLNPVTGAYTATGNISSGGTTGSFQYSRVPEGGTQASYLLASGIVLLAGMLLAVKPWRVAETRAEI
jgi:hypothetical protein